ncbi:hypothetical protein LRS12_10455 [Sphingomonas sp. J344]|uniref:hypothetical protein n=1 Tax=Sphingomonas sp. J344 TaxID=2898434 RepID=UPI002151A28A|nr:hypothetical protein [Sphingomonas sp. J344]MCR5871102.1 hypothetical protein [Sphingomonas sp. J344]
MAAGGGIHGSILLADFTGVPPGENPQISGVADLIFGSVGNFGTAGIVDVTHSGGISATGNNASAIWAQSVAGMPDAGKRQAGGDVSVRVAGGDYRGGGGDGAGIRVANGNLNTITIGPGASVSAQSGVAIRVTDDAGFARTTISNAGTVIGNVLAGEGVRSDFANLMGGLFLPGSHVTLRGGTLSNAGTIAPGGYGLIQTTTLTGGYTQTTGGALDLDIRIGGASDRIAATGGGGDIGPGSPDGRRLCRCLGTRDDPHWIKRKRRRRVGPRYAGSRLVGERHRTECGSRRAIRFRVARHQPGRAQRR